jgi:hypothetical protein
MSFVGARLEVRPERFATKIGVFGVFPVVNEMINLASIYMTDLTEHKPGMHVEKRSYEFVVTVRIYGMACSA